MKKKQTLEIIKKKNGKKWRKSAISKDHLLKIVMFI
jgi:hypothetical protein